MSDSVRPHRRRPTRLPCPWDSPGENTGVGCHFLLQCMKVKSESEVAQSCPTLRDPMDCSPLGFSVHAIFQTRVLDPRHHHFSPETLPSPPCWPSLPSPLRLRHPAARGIKLKWFAHVSFNLVNIFQRRQWHPSPVFCLEKLMDGGAW